MSSNQTTSTQIDQYRKRMQELVASAERSLADWKRRQAKATPGTDRHDITTENVSFWEGALEARKEAVREFDAIFAQA